jgi:hypothetical protein
LTASRRTAIVGRQQFERGQCAVNFTAHAVVVHHIFGIGRQCGLGTRDRVNRLVILHDDGLACHHLHRVFRQGLNEGDRLFIGPGYGSAQCLNAGFTFANCNGI